MDSFTGVINIYKEKGFTSHDVVNIVRKTIRNAVQNPASSKIKTGHTGTLDPIAEGVLPVCIGKATKIAGLIQNADKIYSAVMRLGITTDTEDITGKVLLERDVDTDEDTLKKVVSSFYGKQLQTPPMYSAVKINGKKLYESARAGIELERPQREITIHEISVTEFSGDRASILVSCGKGAYIRTLIKDIGEELGCGACMEELTRIRAGSFFLSGAIRLDELKLLAETGRFHEAVIPIEEILDYPKIRVSEILDSPLHNGNAINKQLVGLSGMIEENKRFLVYDSSGELCGIHTAVGSGEACVLKPEVMLV